MPLWKRLTIVVYSLLILCAGPFDLPRQALAQGGGGGFFSQGQAVYDAQNLAKSQQEALQDLMVQAVTQALGTFLTPAQMGSHFAALQAKILKQPERYVQTYQVFSESPAGGLYRVTGQVTVAMDALKNDIQQLGLTPTPAPAPQPAAPAGQPAPTTPAAAPAEPQPAAPPETRQAPPPASYPVQAETPSRQSPSAEQTILWAVAEKWGDRWTLPASSADVQNLFAMSALQEFQDYSWSLKFPQQGSLSVDTSGNLSRQRLIALAQSMGIQYAVTGDLTFHQGGGQGAAIAASLQVVDVSSGQPKGEIHKELPTSGSHQDGAMRMAYVAVPELDRLLRGSSSTPSVSSPPAPAVSVAAGDEWTLLIHSEYPYVYWEELEEVLRNRFAAMQVNRLEVGPNLAKVAIRGVGAEFLNMLQEGIPMRDGTRVQASGYSPEKRSVELSVGRF